MRMVEIAILSMPAPPRPVDRVIEHFIRAYRVSLSFVTKILILTLFFLSAITFSTEAIPNFQPDCEVSSVRKTVTVSIIKIALPRILSPFRRERARPRTYSSSPPALPLARTPRYVTPSRAPPAPPVLNTAASGN